MSLRRLAPVLLGLLLAPVLAAQDAPAPKPITLEIAAKQPFRFTPRGLNGPAWREDGRSFTHLESSPDGTVLVSVDAATGERATLFGVETLKTAMEQAGVKDFPFGRLAAASWKDGRLELVAEGRRLRIAADGKSVEAESLFPAEAEASAFSPDGAQVAWVADHDISARKRDGTVTRVTRGGFAELTHGVAVSRVEFGIHDGMWWDPTGRRLAFYREDLRPIQPHELVDWSVHPAKRVPDRYPMAGTRNSVVSIGVWDSRDDSVVWLDTKPEEDEYLTNVAWDPTGERILVAHVARSQDLTTLEVYEAASGRHLESLFSERDEQWTEPEHPPIFLPDGSGDFLWFSPRDGYNHLYRYHRDGNLVGQVTRGAFDVTAFRGFSPDGTSILVEASGEDPLQMHLYRVSLAAPEAVVKGAGESAEVEYRFPPLERLTSGRGRHEVLIAPKTGHLLDTWSSLETPTAVDLIAADGGAPRRLHTAPDPWAGWVHGEERFFTVPAADGTPLHGHLVLPPDLDPKKKHPVLLYVYGGPHSQLVTDTWMGGARSLGVWFHHMAAKGYIVVRLDGHGTLNRGIEFQQAIHRRLGTLEIQDQLAAIDHVLSLGFADPARVGVHGWSYGGFMTLSLMTRAGERFAAGVSGAPVTDWSLYETGYGERYMDRPAENEKGYAEADPGNHVEGIRGRLLVVQGTSDVTVVWQHTIDFLAKCIAKAVDVDYFAYPGELHGLRGASRFHFYKKMTAFFDRELRPDGP
ncbi:MAG: DPP IV N-terminal domain-containing protein [Planctomycetota bacterium]